MEQMCCLNVNALVIIMIIIIQIICTTGAFSFDNDEHFADDTVIYFNCDPNC